MRQFFKFLFASCLGVMLAGLLLVGIGSLVVTQLASQANKPKDIKPNTVLHLTFDDPVPEQTNNLEINPFEFSQENTLGLTAITDAIARAAEDDDIKGIYLEVDGLVGMGLANVSVLRKSLKDFKESGKFIVAYSKYYSQGAYYLSSVADEMLINPLGMIDFRGFAAQIPFFKDMLDKVGVEMQVFYAGKFKSATEPYRLNEMSEENRLQVRAYLEGIYENYLEDIAAGRPLSTSELRKLANDYTGLDPQAAADAGMVDQVGYRDVALDILRNKLGLDEDEKIPMVSVNAYDRSNPADKDYSVKDKIAVIYAEGTIVDGKGEAGSVGDDKYMDFVRKARKDDKVKAIVLRVNSPGGSALASENIWRELKLAKEAGKPVVVSMGDYAASGGYYISAMADSIFAEANTLTGSIGVFLVIPNTSELMEDKIGIHFDSVKTGDYSHGITSIYPLSTGEQMLLQKRTDNMYETFLSRVAEGRNMSRDSVHAIAQGRVWTGEAAMNVGLVDRIGGIDQALAAAADLAGLESYRTTEYPKVKEPIQQLMEEFLGEENVKAQLLSHFGLKGYTEQIRFLNDIQGIEGAQARLPILIPFK
jgi:protease-4